MAIDPSDLTFLQKLMKYYYSQDHIVQFLDDLFDRDGFFVKMLESLPVVGFIVGGIHILAGNKDHARRAVAVCANSTIVTSGIIIASSFGGPVCAAIGAGIATPIGIIIETQFSGAIEDPRIRAQFGKATISRFIYDTLRNMSVAGIAAQVGEMLGAILKNALQGVTSTICQWLGKGSVAAVKAALFSGLMKLSDALKVCFGGFSR